VNCEGTLHHSQQDGWLPSRRLPEIVPRQIDLIGAPQRMTVEGPLAVQIGGYRMSSGAQRKLQLVTRGR
jgi:hypothetical protein